MLAFYDKATTSFRAINPRWVQHIVGWKGAIGRRHGKLSSLVPSPYALVDALERWRLAAGGARIARAIALVQYVALLAKRRQRREIVPFAVAVGRPLALSPADIVVSTGSDWNLKDAATVAILKKRFGFRYVVMCYDIIPLLFPQYFMPDDARAFRNYWNEMFSLADKILVNSHRVASDIVAYCDRNGLSLAEFCLVRLGFDASLATTKALLPADLQPGRYIIFVSTIEPRKGHGMLIRVWQRLLEASVPQRQNFKLVFVGRRGWQIDDVFDRIGDKELWNGTLIHLTGVADDTLASLYREAAFCVYPSQYEGFGLPIIEAFSLGKAVIASTGGALPETVGRFSPCLDPNDEDAWFETLKTWIEHPDVREPYESMIRAEFSWPTWDQAASQILDVLKPNQCTGGG